MPWSPPFVLNSLAFKAGDKLLNFCTHWTLTSFLTLICKSRYVIHPYSFRHTLVKRFKTINCFYPILPSIVKISLLFLNGQSTIMVSEKIFKHFYENLPFLPRRQPIKFTDLDKSHMKRRGLLDKHFCKKKFQISPMRQKKLSISSFTIISLWEL